jgi:S-layer family protein
MNVRRAAQVLGSCLAVLAAPGVARAQLPAGPEFRINENTIGLQRAASPAFLADGSFVVTWMDGLQVQEGEIMARRYSASGLPLGGQFQVNSYSTGYQYLSAAAAAPDGRFVVVWTGFDDSFHGVRLRAYDGQGNPAGPERPVNTETLNDQWFPRVAHGGDGFLVTWLGNGLSARLFDAAGLARGAEFRVDANTFVGAVTSVTGWRGGFMVAFSSPHVNGEADVFVRRFDRDAIPVGVEFRVNTTLPGYQAQPSMAAAPDGSFVVAWESLGQDGDLFGIMARGFAADGTPLGPETLVNAGTTGSQRHPRIVADAQGGFVVAWSSGFPQEPGPDGSRDAVVARRLARGGRPLGTDFRVNTYTTGDQGGVDAAGLPDGRVLLAWTSVGQDGHVSGAYAQRYGALAPVRLDVDLTAGPSSNANGVFEPGESAIVAPVWRNLNTSAVAVNGTAFAFGGPGAAAYGVVDGTADYGTVAPDATASCTTAANCYVLSVSAPPARPATHWDARLEEDLSVPRSASWRVHLGDSFADVPRASVFYRSVETVLHHGITAGCGGAAYCPGAATAREQMAVFLLVAREGMGYVPPACAPPNLFEDVPESSPYCRWIEELARRGITGGCDATHFCPAAGVTREQMAVFVLRALDPALDPPACTTPVFADVPAASVFCRWIEELARRGVVAGCGGGNYCPADMVTREQMAVYLAATFSLVLYPA